jgi:hypothetical protein
MGFLFNRYRYSRSVFSIPSCNTIRWIISGIKCTGRQPMWKVSRFSFNWMHFLKRETRGGAVCSGTVLLAGGCEFDSRWGLWNFSRSGRTVAMGSTQSVTAMSTTSNFWEIKWMVSEADNFVTFMCRNLEGSNSCSPPGMHRPVQELLYLALLC